VTSSIYGSSILSISRSTEFWVVARVYERDTCEKLSDPSHDTEVVPSDADTARSCMKETVIVVPAGSDAVPRFSVR
jgi:hypothetical protein